MSSIQLVVFDIAGTTVRDNGSVADSFITDRSPLIDQVICSDEVALGRPHPDMIKVLMQDLDIVSPELVVKVGDTEVDVEEGRNAGCGIVVSVTTGAYTREQLLPYRPDFIIGDLKELLPIVEHA